MSTLIDPKYLTRRVTYREYNERFVGPIEELPPRIQQQIVQKEAELVRELQPGDELWEWDMGGWNSFAGTSGLAILRGGMVIKSWVCWKS